MSNETKQTAVEWLLDRIEDVDLTEKIWENVKQQAKEMEKEQSIKFALYYTFGEQEISEDLKIDIEKLYNETYGGKKMIKNMKTYRKTATVEAKIFEKGDEDGFLFELPFVRTLENNRHGGRFGEHYLCIGIDQEKWLVEKSIFERTYKEVTNDE
jgi:hypothetical protein